ncbi:MAG TPA: hypothetical protein VE224_11260 [Pseudolabrys sp.]|nr:hypothetical protein [Pseudolabrys sp.]
MKAWLAGLVVFGVAAAGTVPAMAGDIHAQPAPRDTQALVVTIPNHRSEAQARQQIDKALAGIQRDYGSFFTIKYRHWTGNRLRLRASLLGQPAFGHIDVKRTHVDVRIMLPGGLPFIADMAQPAILKAGTRMLAKR